MGEKWRRISKGSSCSSKALLTKNLIGEELLRCPSCGLARRIFEYKMTYKEKKWVTILLEREKTLKE